MMHFIFTIGCGDAKHNLELTHNGTMVPLDHNLEMIAAFTAFGATKPTCLEAIEAWEKGPEKFFEVDSWGRAFSDTFWEGYDDFEDDVDDEMPLVGLPDKEFVDTLIHLLRYSIEEEETDHARILAEILYEHIDEKKDVEIKRDIRHDDDGSYERSYAYDNRILLIRGTQVAAWMLASERYVYDPFTFQSQVQELEIDDMPGEGVETPWAVNETLEALHVEEPEAAEPLSPVDPPDCPEGKRCDFAVVYIGDFGSERRVVHAVQYERIFSAKEGLEISTSLLSSWGAGDMDDITSVAVRRTPQERDEFAALARQFDIALSQHSLFPMDSTADLDPELRVLAEMDEDELELRRTWRLVSEEEADAISDAEFKKEYGYSRRRDW